MSKGQKSNQGNAVKHKFYGSSFLIATSYGVLDEDTSDFETITTCQDGLACCKDVCKKSCVSCACGIWRTTRRI